MPALCPFCGILYRVRGLDRILVVAALLLVAVVAVDALRGRGGSVAGPDSQSSAPPATSVALQQAAPPEGRPPAPAPVVEAPVPEQVRLVPSSTTFLPRCPTDSLALAVGPGPQLVLRFAGRRCHVPPLHLQATVRDATDRIVYQGPALADEDLSGNFAGAGTRRARLVVGCRTEPLVATVTGSGLSASGPVRCRGSH